MRARIFALLEPFFLREWTRVSAWQLLLQPISWLFAALSAYRRWLFQIGFFRTHRSRVPVIVVGNISVGGTGKTPAVLALAQHLRQHGQSPGIVTRGYAKKGLDTSPGMVIHVVPPPSHRAAMPLSDEALLLAKRSGVPVFAGVARAKVIDEMLSKHAEINVVISDDGLQHYAMARDIEIAVIDGARGLGNGFLLPAGPLRETASRLQTVDCVILNNTNIDGAFEAKMPENARGIYDLPNELPITPKSVRGEPVEPPATDIKSAGDENALRQAQRERGDGNNFKKDTPVFIMTYGHETFIPLHGHGNDANHPTSPLVTLGHAPQDFLTQTQQKRIAAVAGIGNPARFFTHLERLGFKLSTTHAFPDHHAYRREDFAKIDADIILMTEKDAVKCEGFADARMWQMQIDAVLPDAFYDFIQQKINHVTRPQTA
jgi:tetraacyldisaccharide 4'-kinase